VVVLLAGLLACKGTGNTDSPGGTPAGAEGGASSNGVPANGGSTSAPGGGSSPGAPLTPHAPVPWSSVEAPAHPQVLFNAARLDELRKLRTTPAYALIHNFASAWLDWQGNRSDHGLGAEGWYIDVGGYAVLAEIEQKHVDTALSYLTAFCNSTWSSDHDLMEAHQLISASVAYDVLFHEPGLSPIAATCRSKIVTAARNLFNGVKGGQWWWNDYVNNHNWHDVAALGVAGLVLRGDATYDAEAAAWRAATDADFATVAKVQAYISDGSWHEGIGYGEFGISSQMYYWMGAERAGSTPSDDTPFVRNWSRYLLGLQQPNHPRTYALTTGDWVHPGVIEVSIFKWIARRFADPVAQEAGARWDLEGRPVGSYTWLSRLDWAMAYALELIAYDPSVPALGSAVPLPVDSYHDDQGSFVMRSGWGASTSGSNSLGLVVTLKNGFHGGKGNAQRMSSCTLAPGSNLDIAHDHEDDFGLYVYGNGGWLLPEATGYNCCGTGTSSDPDAYTDTVWHNSVTFDGIGQLGDDKLSTHSNDIQCGTPPGWFAQRKPSLPVHASTTHFAIGQADGLHLYPSSIGLTRALRTVLFDRETPLIALTDELAFAAGTSHAVEQHFHAMKGATSMVSAPWLYLDNSTNPADDPDRTVNASSTVLGLQVIAPAQAALSMQVQQSNDYREWMSPSGAYAHAVVSTGAKVPGARLLEMLWPTTTAAWASRPTAGALDPQHPQNGFSVPLGAGAESILLNSTGSATAAGRLRIDGTLTSDLGLVRTDGTRITRLLLMALGGGRLSDQEGARTLLDLGTSGGVLEAAFDGAGNVDLSGTASVSGVRFYAASAPVSVTSNGAGVRWTRDATTGLVTVSGAGL